MNLISDNPNKCRACLMENPLQIFGWTALLETGTITYLECFQKCTKLEAYADDQLPQSLCFQCAAELRDAYEFIKKAIQSHQTLLMKQEPLFSKADEEVQEAAGFEWVAVQKTDADDIINTDNITNVNVKTSFSHKLVNTAEELIINADAYIVDACDTTSDDNFDCNPTSPQGDDDDSDDASYVPEKEIKIKPKDDTIKVPNSNVKPVTNRKCRKQKLGDAEKTEKTEEHEELDQQSKADVECELSNKPFPRQEIKRHIKRVHNVRMLLSQDEKRSVPGFEWDPVQKADIAIDNISDTPKNATLKHKQDITDKKFHCTICDMHFKRKYTLNRHKEFRHKILKTEAGDKHTPVFVNSKTSEQLTVASEFTEDKDICSDNVENIECAVCKRIFTAAKYTAHFSKVHKKSPNGHQCPKCSKYFAYKHQLKTHFEVHHGLRQKNVPCTMCPKMFYDKHLLHTHMITHRSTEISYKCDLCGKGFRRKSGLRRHKIMHQGGKEQCNECAKRFPNITELRVHMLIHKKENPFLCNICGQSFRLQGPLSYHMKKHRGEKFECEHCGKAFACQSTFRRHEYKHIGLPFKCPRCDAGQVTRGSLQRHLKEVHKSDLTAVELRDLYNSIQNSRLQ